jgi:hypothetical protein
MNNFSFPFFTLDVVQVVGWLGVVVNIFGSTS